MTNSRIGRGAVIAWTTVFVVLGLPGASSQAQTATSHGYLELIGSMHEHSAYSDGWPGTAPATYYQSGKDQGLDFLAGSEHSDNADAPVTASEGCLPTTDGNEGPAACVQTDGNDDEQPDLDAARKWDATLEQARAATVPGAYTGIRGFEWTSDNFNHINVYYSRNDTNAKTDGGYAATMETFWKWFTTRPEFGGGSDGLATFNHPGDKDLPGVGNVPPSAFNWNDFAYVPAADDRMVGIELYNDTSTYGSFYVRALDKGWHVGAVGAEDLGHKKDDVWGAPDWAKTVILATGNSEAEIRSAMLARRFYAVAQNANDLRIDFTIDGAIMGSRLTRQAGTTLNIAATVANAPGAVLEVITNGGAVVPKKPDGSWVASAGAGEQYYFLRVLNGGKPVAYSSPIWVSPHPRAQWGEWLAGDLHVHTCYSHDAYCPTEVYGPAFGYDPPPGTEPEDPFEFYTLSATVEERFIEAEARGLDYLAITDHNDVSSVTDAGFGTRGVIGVAGYEASIDGHAQMLGAERIYDRSDIPKMAGDLRRDGGLFQANHPADPTDNTYKPMETCDDTDELHWGYGYDVPVETVEVWNIGHVLQPPVPSGTSNEDALKYWECWLDRGVRVGATGGSDSHWLSTAAVQGPGNPTTWIFARERSSAGVLQALREGRTTISVTPPVLGALQLLLEGDADGDGIFESMIGDAVPAGAAIRLRAEGLPGAGLVRVRYNGQTIVDHEPLAPGQTLEIDRALFTEPGWIHATLYGPDAYAERNEVCDPRAEELEQDLPDDLIPDDLTDDEPQQRATYCRNHVAVLAQTSAMYIAVPTTLAFEQITTHGESVQLAAKLLDDNGDPLTGKTITFTIRDVTVEAETDDRGVAQATLVVPDHGRSQIATASYAGELWYAPSSATATVTWGLGPLLS